jgi:hypothetical protein
MKNVCYCCSVIFEYNKNLSASGYYPACLECCIKIYVATGASVEQATARIRNYSQNGNGFPVGSYWDNIFNEVKNELNNKKICDGCKKPAPHIKSNFEDKFICIGCKFLGEFNGNA